MAVAQQRLVDAGLAHQRVAASTKDEDVLSITCKSVGFAICHQADAAWPAQAQSIGFDDGAPPVFAADDG